MADTAVSQPPSDSSGQPSPLRARKIEPGNIHHVEIFPPIGVARVGDSGATDIGEPDPESRIEYYYGPEVPGVTEPPAPSFRDMHGKIKRQAVRFRVYAYDSAGKMLGEINNAEGYTLNWTVHVANKKAAFYCTSGGVGEFKPHLRNPDVDSVPADETLRCTESHELRDRMDPFEFKSLDKRKRLIVDPGAKKIARVIDSKQDPVPVPIVGKFRGSLSSAADAIDVTLGELRTDDAGRLVFIGGSGVARSVLGSGATTELVQPEIISQFDSIDWIDSICDGWVDVRVAHAERPNLAGSIPPPHKATILSAPPKFAWGIQNPVTLYDIMENIYKEEMSYVEHHCTDFYKDIWPVLASSCRFAWVNGKALQGHGPRGYGNYLAQENQLSTPNGDSALRQQIFDRLREPNFRNKDQAHVTFMPPLSGDDGDAISAGETIRSTVREPIKRFLALTELQYDRFSDWKEGRFVTGTPYGTKKSIEEYDEHEQPLLLTRAMLEQTIGSALYPGIEAYWITKHPGAYDFSASLKNLCPPFRINHTKVRPGFLTRGLCLPWQSDFSMCNENWWPSARPDDVFVLSKPWSESTAGAVVPSLDVGDKYSSGSLSIRDFATVPSKESNVRHKSWTRGMRDKPAGVEMAGTFLPGSTDMVKFWTELGFVKRIDVNAPEQPGGHVPVWVEEERKEINEFV